MSTADNFHRKVLSNNALKTNFNSNTNQKNKSQNQKRFSNISKEKQTIQKNTTRYYEQVDMQGSATIIPQKSSSRQSIYANQNNNHIVQVSTQQRKQLGLANLNVKAKSPIDKHRINLEINIQNQNKFAQIKNISKITDLKTERQKSAKSYRHKDDQKQSFKIKSMIVNTTQTNNQIDQDWICNEQMDVGSLPQKQHARKLSNTFTVKNQAKETVSLDQFSNDYHSKTQKKYPTEKPTSTLQKVSLDYNISIKQQQSGATGMNGLNSAVIQANQPNTQQKTVSNHQNPCNPNFHAIINRQSSKNHLPVVIINHEQELKKFHQLQNEINLGAEVETIIRLEQRQKYYIVQPNYIEVKQKNFNWFMRAVLMDWMVHVCFEFGLKRQTYYVSLSLADKYLQMTNDLPKSQFQLVGAACMFIAAKLQEFQALSSTDFSKSTDNRYSANEIKQTELKICKTMNYELNPPTLNMWANRFMVHWDNYIELTNAKFHPYFSSHNPKHFKRESQQSYMLFRQMMQMLDCSILDVQTLQFAPKILVCSFMYLVLGINYKQWSTKRIVEEFPRSSHYLVSQEQISCFNHLFHMFLSDSFELDIIQLLPAIQYCSTYFTLQLNFDTPSCSKGEDQEETQMSLEQYESCQTYNGKMIDLIKRRYRGVYL